MFRGVIFHNPEIESELEKSGKIRLFFEINYNFVSRYKIHYT